MSISGSGFTPPRFDPPQVFDETASNFQLLKSGETGKGVVIVPPEQSLDVPFTKFDNRNRWPTSTQADTPLLHQPLAQLRGAPADPQIRDEGWQSSYQEMVAELDPELAAELNNPTMPETQPFKESLELLARGSLWVDTTVQNLENPEKSRLDPAIGAFADAGYNSALSTGVELLDTFDAHLEEEGPNNPLYDEAKQTVNEFRSILGEVSS